MACFVRYYEDFKNEELSNQDVADKIYRDNGYSYKSCNSRTGHARMILREGGAIKALEIIANSERVDQAVAIKAQELMEFEL